MPHFPQNAIATCESRANPHDCPCVAFASDETARVTIEEITARIRNFRDERDWKQFHNPKEMAVAIAVEAGELLEHFAWKTAEQSEECALTKREEISEEMADIAILLFEMADNIGVNLAESIEAKLAKNALKYPVSKARGSNRKYNEL
jgi:dCTP diphosphatase